MSKKEFIEKKIEKLEWELHEMRVAMTTYYDEEALRAHGMREKEKKMEADIQSWKAVLMWIEVTGAKHLDSRVAFIRGRVENFQKLRQELEEKISDFKKDEEEYQDLLLKLEELEKIQ